MRGDLDCHLFFVVRVAVFLYIYFKVIFDCLLFFIVRCDSLLFFPLLFVTFSFVCRCGCCCFSLYRRQGYIYGCLLFFFCYVCDSLFCFVFSWVLLFFLYIDAKVICDCLLFFLVMCNSILFFFDM